MKPLLKYLGASAVLVILIGSLAGNVLLYKQVKALKADPTLTVSKENDRLIAALGRLMVLPDETPTIATVEDLEKLKGQPFFDHAKVGDKVFIFTAAKKAVLYDPVADKIVESAPLSDTSAEVNSDMTTGVDAEADTNANVNAEMETNTNTTSKKVIR